MASKDSALVSQQISEIAAIILEERNKGPTDWFGRQWAGANKHLVCTTCKENKVECIPMDTRIHCNSSVCKQSDKPCSKLNDELYDRIAKRVPNLDRATFDDVMSPQRSTESTGLSLKIPARRPSSRYVSTSKRLSVQNSTSSDESISAKSSGTPPNSRIQTLSQKLEAKSRENDELLMELTNLKADWGKQKSETEAEIQALKVELDTTKAACTAVNERAEREANLRREMEQNVTPQEQIDALKKDLEDSRQQLIEKQRIQDQLKNEITVLQRESSRTTTSIEKHGSKVTALRHQIESERTARLRLDLAELYHTRSERVCLAEALADQSESGLVPAVRMHLKVLDEIVKRKRASIPRSFDRLLEVMNGENSVVNREREDISGEMDSNEDRDKEMSVPSVPPLPRKKRKLRD
ncbi:hypothetical protein ARMGADRAFT_1009324 [Armillaria gallica]|uniref:Uncharacterized protein n=1 Tax=Armillaria gallica TaxID=47427 RepID=A0A2H3E2B9_ARMGA|nr:hypothetical protein ARMGADRAFT_1009324 [Armillaria gallica]